MLTSRRTLLKGLGVTTVFVAWNGTRQIRYVSNPDSIRVIETGKEIQRLDSKRPRSLTLSPGGTMLLAVNEIDEYQGLPCGSIESYRVHPVTGRLSLISRRALSLSATLPRSLALSPCGKYVAVAAYGGGIYNVFPINSNGQLQPLTQAIKEIGPNPAHPHSLRFHPSGNLIFSADMSCNRTSVFSFHDGVMTREIS